MRFVQNRALACIISTVNSAVNADSWTEPYLSRKTFPLVALALMASAALLPITAKGEIFVVNQGNGTVGAYTNQGTPVNTSLISNLNIATGIAVSGSYLFVATAGNGCIAEYTTSGTLINATLVSGLTNPIGMVVNGSNLFVVDTNHQTGKGMIGEYTLGPTPGTVTSSLPSLVTGLNQPNFIATSGSDLFVTAQAYANGGPVGEYSTTGTTVNAFLITLSTHSQVFGIAASGSDLFVSDEFTKTISEFTVHGGVIQNPLISGPNLGGVEGMAIFGSELFVTDLGNNTIDEYTLGATAGTITSFTPSLITGLDIPFDIAVTPDVPEPGTLMILATASTTMLMGRRRSRIHRH